MSEDSHTVINPVVKFTIGCIAGLCATLFPRFIAYFGAAENTIVFPRDYLVLAILFSVILGIVVVIFEWNAPAKPRDTFMMALGLPALLTSAFNSTFEARNLKKATDDVQISYKKEVEALRKQRDDLSAKLIESTGIKIISHSSRVPTSDAEPGRFVQGIPHGDIPGIDAASAADHPSSGLDPAIQLPSPVRNTNRQPVYLSLVDKAQFRDGGGHAQRLP